MLPVYYVLKVFISSGILMLYYNAVLRNKRFHYYNRIYLLMSVAISFVLPFFKLELFTVQSENEGAIAMLNVIGVNGEKNTVAGVDNGYLNPQVLIAGVCIIITAIMLGVLLYKIKKLHRLKKRYSIVKMPEFDFVHTDLEQAPFSFFRNLFWRNDIDIYSATGQQILQHEITHIQQKHSWDKLFMQVLLAVFWMNPFYWFIKKELHLVHEFIADEQAIKDKDAGSFAAMLLKVQYGDSVFAPGQSFNYSPIKRRLFMLSTSKESRYSYARRLLALPLLAMIVCLFAFKLNKQEDGKGVKTNLSFTLIVDAGHGGKDFGAIGLNNNYEKDIALALAKKLKTISNEYNINVVLTREADVYMTPQQKADFANKVKGDAFVSLHVNVSNADEKNTSGIEVMISDKNGEYNNSRLWGSAVLQTLNENFLTNKSLMQPLTTVWVLKAVTTPAILIECGFIDNSADMEMLNNEEKTDLLARKILEGTVKYANNSNSTKETTYNLKYQSAVFEASAQEDTLKPPPLYIVDGKETEPSVAKKIDPNIIKQVNVLKDKNATDKYGEKGKNGVVEIITKKKTNASTGA